MYSCIMYWICMYTVTRQANWKFNPVYTIQENWWCMVCKKPLWMLGIYQVELRSPDMGQITQVSSMAHMVLATFDLGHCFGHDWSLLDLKLSSFLLGLFILSHSQMTHGVWTINQIWSFTPKTLLFLKKNCSPIDEQWEESSPFGWYIVIHQPEIKEIFGWFPFATNVMTSWWGHCNLNHDQWTEKDMGWYVALSKMWYSKPQIDRKDGDQEILGETSSN